MELIETFPQFVEAVKALRWLIAIPFIVIAVLSLWGWWKGVTV